MILKCIRTVAMAALAMVSINVSGQDLLARQAPIDRKLKAVDSLALIRQIKAEQAVYPAYSLYPNWNNDRVHAYGGNVQVPDSFRIDLTGFCMPTTHTVITSKCGPRWRRMHNGLDIKVYIGDTIRAAFDGRVRMVKYERRGYGKYVVIRHDNGLETIYGHLSKQIVAEDEYVKAGDPIGLGGNTGRSTGSHLHFETRFLGEVINPEFMFDFRIKILCQTAICLYVVPTVMHISVPVHWQLLNQENPEQPKQKNRLSVIIKSVRAIHWDVSLACITYPLTACARLMV